MCADMANMKDVATSLQAATNPLVDWARARVAAEHLLRVSHCEVDPLDILDVTQAGPIPAQCSVTVTAGGVRT